MYFIARYCGSYDIGATCLYQMRNARLCGERNRFMRCWLRAGLTSGPAGSLLELVDSGQTWLPMLSCLLLQANARFLVGWEAPDIDSETIRYRTITALLDLGYGHLEG